MNTMPWSRRRALRFPPCPAPHPDLRLSPCRAPFVNSEINDEWIAQGVKEKAYEDRVATLLDQLFDQNKQLQLTLEPLAKAHAKMVVGNIAVECLREFQKLVGNFLSFFIVLEGFRVIRKLSDLNTL